MPFLIVLKISLAEQAIGIPPYTPLVEAGGRSRRARRAYARLISDDLYSRAYLNSLRIAAIATRSAC